MSYEAELRVLCNDLGLPFEEQDWGIIAAAGDRVDEFVAYYERRTDATPLQKRLLGELILASINDAIEAGPLKPVTGERCARFVRTVRAEQVDNLVYWSSLTPGGADAFPVAAWLRRILAT